MNDFLDQVWLDNTLRSYLVVAIVILFIIIVKRYVAKYIAMLIFQFVKRIWKDIEKKPFIALVAKPLGFFLAVFTSVIALNKLVFPQQLNVDIYHVTVKELAHGLGRLAIILSFIRLMTRMIDFISIILTIRANRTHDTTDNQLIVFFKDFFKVIFMIIGLLMIMKYTFGYSISNLLTGLSIVGAAIALALRESLENLIASFIIFLDKPFQVGDSVKVHSFSGTVEKIGLRSTRIRTDQKTFITVPNKQMVDSILDNLSQRTQRKGELRLEISLSTSSEAIEELIKEIRMITGRKEISSATVILNDITATAFQINVDYFTGPVTQEEFNRIKEGINLSVLKLMEKMGIEIAGAVTDIKLTGSSETPGN
jgi:MscS family membrane protein